MQLPYRFNLWYRYRDSTWPLRIKVIREAFTWDDDGDVERLTFMTDRRFFDYACQQAEMRGKLDVISEMPAYIRDNLTHQQIRELIAAWGEGVENVMQLVKKSYLNRDGKYFYIGDDK
jgi:hypothetical protein